MAGYHPTLSHHPDWTSIPRPLAWQGGCSTEWHSSVLCHPWDDACSGWCWRYGMGESESSSYSLPQNFLSPILIKFLCVTRLGRSAARPLPTPITLFYPRLWNDGRAVCCSTFFHVIWRLYTALIMSSCRYESNCFGIGHLFLKLRYHTCTHKTEPANQSINQSNRKMNLPCWHI